MITHEELIELGFVFLLYENQYLIEYQSGFFLLFENTFLYTVGDGECENDFSLLGKATTKQQLKNLINALNELE